ncbi:MAG: hypothetical protein EBU73_09010, partial [Chitinophagia bacterium]|nr:hypothetical protein [Chitinophagia bacterium]
MVYRFILLLVVAFVSQLQVQSQVPSYVNKEDLVGWWGFNGNANDESGNNHHGQTYNVELSKDRNDVEGIAYKFFKAGSKIRIPDPFDSNYASLSVSFWVKSSGVSSECYVYKVQENTAQHEMFAVFSNSADNPFIQFCVKNDGSCQPGTGWLRNTWKNSIQDNQWHHILAVYDVVGSSNLYVDGQLVSQLYSDRLYNEAQYSPIDVCSGGELIIGKSWDATSNFDGWIDDIGVWSTPLTQIDAILLYSENKPELKKPFLSQEVIIGNQVWMKMNLETETFRNGDPIPEAKSQEELALADSLKLPAWHYLDFNPEQNLIGGKVYNWYAVTDPRGLAPNGWHIPTKTEWIELIDYSKKLVVRDTQVNDDVKNSMSPIDSLIYDPVGKPSLFKSKIGGWSLAGVSEGDDYLSMVGMDSTGFSALPSGCHWWSSTETFAGSNKSWSFILEESFFFMCNNSVESELGKGDFVKFNQELGRSELDVEYVTADGKLNQTK